MRCHSLQVACLLVLAVTSTQAQQSRDLDYDAVARYRRFGLADTAGALLTTYPASYYYAVAPVEDLEVAKAIHNSGVPSFRVKRQGNVFIRRITRNRHRNRIQNIAGRK